MSQPADDPDLKTEKVNTDAETLKTGPKEDEPHPLTAPTPPLFKFNQNSPHTTWRRKTADDHQYIQIVVERAGMPNGAVISDRLEPHLLFKLAPALRKYLEGRRIHMPAATCLDEDFVNDIAHGLVRCAKEGIPVPEPMDQTPIPMIKIHCVLTFFEMRKEADGLLKKLWNLFGKVELQPTDVLWIWDAFGTRMRSDLYTAPYADEYVQMMAWQILNVDRMCKLHDDIRSFIALEKEPKYFTEMLLARKKTHGYDKDLSAPKESEKVPTEATAATNVNRGTSNMTEQHPIDRNSMVPTANQAGHSTAVQDSAKPTTERAYGQAMSALDTVLSKAPKFRSAGFTDPFKEEKSPPHVPFGQPEPRAQFSEATTTSPFGFSNASKPISAYTPSASQPRATASGFTFGGSRAPNPTVPGSTTASPAPSTSSAVSAPSTPAFPGFSYNTAHQSPIPNPTPKRFAFTQFHPTPREPTPSNPILNNRQQRVDVPPRPPAALQRAPDYFVEAWNRLSGPSPTTPAPQTGIFHPCLGFVAASPTTPTSFTSPSHTFGPGIPPSAGMPVPPSTSAPSTFGGQAATQNENQNQNQSQSASPFGTPFNPASFSNPDAGNSMFGFQGAPGGNGSAGGGGAGASGGGMVRRLARPTGARRKR